MWGVCLIWVGVWINDLRQPESSLIIKSRIFHQKRVWKFWLSSSICTTPRGCRMNLQQFSVIRVLHSHVKWLRYIITKVFSVVNRAGRARKDLPVLGMDHMFKWTPKTNPTWAPFSSQNELWNDSSSIVHARNCYKGLSQIKSRWSTFSLLVALQLCHD